MEIWSKGTAIFFLSSWYALRHEVKFLTTSSLHWEQHSTHTAKWMRTVSTLNTTYFPGDWRELKQFRQLCEHDLYIFLKIRCLYPWVHVLYILVLSRSFSLLVEKMGSKTIASWQSYINTLAGIFYYYIFLKQ